MNPEITSGGRGLSFYASIRLNVRGGEKIADPARKDKIKGHIVNTRVVKNKTATPQMTASFPLIYCVGVDKLSEVVDIAIMAEIIHKGGAYYKIKDDEDKPIVRKRKIQVTDEEGNLKTETIETIMNFNGKERVVEYLRTDDDLYQLLERAIRGEEIPKELFKGEPDESESN